MLVFAPEDMKPRKAPAGFGRPPRSMKKVLLSDPFYNAAVRSTVRKTTRGCDFDCTKEDEEEKEAPRAAFTTPEMEARGSPPPAPFAPEKPPSKQRRPWLAGAVVLSPKRLRVAPPSPDAAGGGGSSAAPVSFAPAVSQRTGSVARPPLNRTAPVSLKRLASLAQRASEFPRGGPCPLARTPSDAVVLVRGPGGEDLRVPQETYQRLSAASPALLVSVAMEKMFRPQDCGREMSCSPAGGQDRGCTPVGEQDRGCTPAGEQDRGCTPTGGQDRECSPAGGQDRECSPAGGQDRECSPAGGQDRGRTPELTGNSTSPASSTFSEEYNPETPKMENPNAAPYDPEAMPRVEGSSGSSSSSSSGQTLLYSVPTDDPDLTPERDDGLPRRATSPLPDSSRSPTSPLPDRGEGGSLRRRSASPSPPTAVRGAPSGGRTARRFPPAEGGRRRLRFNPVAKGGRRAATPPPSSDRARLLSPAPRVRLPTPVTPSSLAPEKDEAAVGSLRERLFSPEVEGTKPTVAALGQSISSLRGSVQAMADCGPDLVHIAEGAVERLKLLRADADGRKDIFSSPHMDYAQDFVDTLWQLTKIARRTLEIAKDAVLHAEGVAETINHITRDTIKDADAKFAARVKAEDDLAIAAQEEVYVEQAKKLQAKKEEDMKLLAKWEEEYAAAVEPAMKEEGAAAAEPAKKKKEGAAAAEPAKKKKKGAAAAEPSKKKKKGAAAQEEVVPETPPQEEEELYDEPPSQVIPDLANDDA